MNVLIVFLEFFY